MWAGSGGEDRDSRTKCAGEGTGGVDVHSTICARGNVSFAPVLVGASGCRGLLGYHEAFVVLTAEVGVPGEGLQQGEKIYSRNVLLVGKKIKHLAAFGLV